MMVIGPGRVNLSGCVVAGARAARLGLMHAALQPQRTGHGRHHRLVAVVADAHLDLARKVDAVDLFEKAVHEMLPRLFAVGDDVDAGVFLQLDRLRGGVELAVLQAAAPESFHGAHSLLGSASQAGFGRLPAIVVGNSVTPAPVAPALRRIVAPAIDPVVALADRRAAKPPHHEVAHRGVGAAILIDSAVLARGALHLAVRARRSCS